MGSILFYFLSFPTPWTVCLLKQRIHSGYPGTFDLGLHKKLWDERSPLSLEELGKMEEPEVVEASEMKTAVKHAQELLSGLVWDCQFPSFESKNRTKVLMQIVFSTTQSTLANRSKLSKWKSGYKSANFPNIKLNIVL